MELVVVERSFDEPKEVSELAAIEAQFAWCLAQHRVRWVRTFVSNDKRRMLCFYEAPDAESVREVQRTAGMPVERVWSATELTG
ncbi:MAG: DUF4242 domain-containing protein [Sandaracinaceae bacterium]|nr:DUF4242 domain-containing protein [Sandaracinaceae bacterium]